MRIASLLPIGPLDRFGYQHAADVVIRNHCDFFDKVYVIASSRMVASLPYASPKIVFVQDDRSLFALDPRGNEMLDFPKLNENVNRVKDMALADGCELAAEIHINQYVPARNFGSLRAHCQAILDAGKPYGLLYKAYQYHDRVYFPSHRLPWIVNLRDHGPRLAFESDSLFVDGQLQKIEDGRYASAADVSVMDIMGCYTVQDDREKFDYYTKVLNKTYGKEGVAMEYSAEDYFKYHKHKLLAKRPHPIGLCDYGREVLARYPADSVGEALVKATGAWPRALYQAERIGRKLRLVRN